MDKGTILVAKVVATSNDSSWAQAYSAGKLYIVLSLEGTSDTPLASVGKDTLEKLQREFFALDQKTLTSVKKAVEEVYKTIPETVTLSLVLGTVVENVLYVVLINGASVLVKRQDKVSVLATGKEQEIIALSGKFEPHDIFTFLTQDFLKTVSFKDLSSSHAADVPNEIGENLAPFLHENASGAEAALVIKINEPILDVVETEDGETMETGNDHLSLDESKQETHSKRSLPSASSVIPFIKARIPRRLSKKQLIIIAVCVLVVILIGSMFFENMKRQENAYTAQVNEILTQNKQKFEDALNVMSLNKSLAVEELEQIKTDIEGKISDFPEGSKARAELETFYNQVTTALQDGGGGSSTINVFFDASKNSDVSSVTSITNKGGQIAVAGSTNGAILSGSGAVESTFDTANAKGITADEDNVYVLTSNSVEKAEKANGDTEEIIDVSGASIDTFGGNIYILRDGTVKRFRPTAYTEESYFTNDIPLEKPSSIAIDASIFVAENGGIKKFTRGTEDSFTYKGPGLSSKALLYTDEDYANIYIVDPEKKIAVVVDKSGNTVKETSLKGMKKITGVSASEKDKKMYVAADNKIYSIEL